MNNLTQRDLQMFGRFGITPELLQEAGVRRVTDAECRDLLAINGHTGDMAGVFFPYLNPRTGRRCAARVRRDNPEMEDGREKNKYLSGYGDRRHLYFAPSAAEMLNDPAVPVLLVEAEKSALALSAWSERTGKRMLPIGLGGCWGWRGRIGKVENPNGDRVDEVGPLPDLTCCANRKVYVVLDSNVSSNPLVKAARRELVKTLRKMKANVHSLDLPDADGVNGPDDFLAVKGDAALSALFETASAAKYAREEKKPPILAQPDLVQLSTVEAENVSFLWDPYLPIGKLTLLEGDPALGKTFAALSICAAVTRGWIPAGMKLWTRKEENVLYMTAEDGIADTIRKRFDKLEGDASRLYVLRGAIVEGESITISLSDLRVIEESIERTHARLLVVDPIQGFLGAKVDMHRANEVRPVLSALARLAEQHRVAVLLIRHLSKAQQSRAIYRGLGSIDLAAAARSVLLVGANPDNPEERGIVHIKCSLAPQGQSLGFRIGEDGFTWTGACDLTASGMLSEQSAPEDVTCFDEALEFLRAVLADGRCLADEVKAEARTAGISERTLRRAADKAVNKEKDRQWYWSLKSKYVVSKVAKQGAQNVQA